MVELIGRRLYCYLLRPSRFVYHVRRFRHTERLFVILLQPCPCCLVRRLEYSERYLARRQKWSWHVLAY